MANFKTYNGIWVKAVKPIVPTQINGDIIQPGEKVQMLVQKLGGFVCFVGKLGTYDSKDLARSVEPINDIEERRK